MTRSGLPALTPGFEVIPQPTGGDGPVAFQPLGRRGRGHAHSDERRHVLGTAATISFLRAADHLRLQTGSPGDEHSPRTLGAMELVGGEGEKIDVDRSAVDRHSTDRLNRIGVKSNSMFATEPADLLDGLDQTGLVVDPHHADQRQR